MTRTTTTRREDRRTSASDQLARGPVLKHSVPSMSHVMAVTALPLEAPCRASSDEEATSIRFRVLFTFGCQTERWTDR